MQARRAIARTELQVQSRVFVATCKKCRPPTAAILPKSSRVSDYVINNDSCDDSQPSLTIALPAWSALKLSIETFVFCLKKEAVLREERKTLKPSRLWAIAIVTGYLITASLKIALTI
ncbi:hypothetical protein IQ270_26570 [Microcoleus sp. LEGE 07076]|uniref:hypothetical protein n=1 Tax=Microcoleus sp. LEGE 07076 TaxID=915322 RepID=UPI00187FC93D|nr:hypothetical protein [Microcoleus sp. LEGE 07076]MBE9188104.1 hypothetical protein [Microcoleus sp. LEGE 07076]